MAFGSPINSSTKTENKLNRSVFYVVAAMNPYFMDFIFLILGLSIFVDIVILLGSVKVRMIRKVRIINGIIVISLLVLAYLVSILLNLFGYLSFSGTYAGILLVFLILLVFYVGILRGMS